MPDAATGHFPPSGVRKTDSTIDGMVTARTSVGHFAGASRGRLRLPLLWLAAASVAGFAADAWEVLGRPPPAIDVAIERAIQAVPWGPLVAVFGWVDWFEGWKELAAAGLGLLAVAIWNRRGLLLTAWGALSGVLYTVLELAIQRPRPDAHLVHVIRHTTGWSFPSGHEMFLTWFLTYLLLVFGRGRLPRPLYVAGWVVLGVVLATVAVGRVYMGEHWPTDVLAGLLLGAAWTLFGLSVRRLSDPVLDG
jgi:undecaprenyl-diphosphatase